MLINNIRKILLVVTLVTSTTLPLNSVFPIVMGPTVWTISFGQYTFHTITILLGIYGIIKFLRYLIKNIRRFYNNIKNVCKFIKILIDRLWWATENSWMFYSYFGITFAILRYKKKKLSRFSKNYKNFIEYEDTKIIRVKLFDKKIVRFIKGERYETREPNYVFMVTKDLTRSNARKDLMELSTILNLPTVPYFEIPCLATKLYYTRLDIVQERGVAKKAIRKNYEKFLQTHDEGAYLNWFHMGKPKFHSLDPEIQVILKTMVKPTVQLPTPVLQTILVKLNNPGLQFQDIRLTIISKYIYDYLQTVTLVQNFFVTKQHEILIHEILRNLVIHGNSQNIQIKIQQVVIQTINNTIQKPSKLLEIAAKIESTTDKKITFEQVIATMLQLLQKQITIQPDEAIVIAISFAITIFLAVNIHDLCTRKIKIKKSKFFRMILITMAIVMLFTTQLKTNSLLEFTLMGYISVMVVLSFCFLIFARISLWNTREHPPKNIIKGAFLHAKLVVRAVSFLPAKLVVRAFSFLHAKLVALACAWNNTNKPRKNFNAFSLGFFNSTVFLYYIFLLIILYSLRKLLSLQTVIIIIVSFYFCLRGYFQFKKHTQLIPKEIIKGPYFLDWLSARSGWSKLKSIYGWSNPPRRSSFAVRAFMGVIPWWWALPQVIIVFVWQLSSLTRDLIFLSVCYYCCIKSYEKYIAFLTSLKVSRTDKSRKPSDSSMPIDWVFFWLSIGGTFMIHAIYIGYKLFKDDHVFTYATMVIFVCFYFCLRLILWFNIRQEVPDIVGKPQKHATLFTEELGLLLLKHYFFYLIAILAISRDIHLLYKWEFSKYTVPRYYTEFFYEKHSLIFNNQTYRLKTVVKVAPETFYMAQKQIPFYKKNFKLSFEPVTCKYVATIQKGQIHLHDINKTQQQWIQLWEAHILNTQDMQTHPQLLYQSQEKFSQVSPNNIFIFVYKKIEDSFSFHTIHKTGYNLFDTVEGVIGGFLAYGTIIPLFFGFVGGYVLPKIAFAKPWLKFLLLVTSIVSNKFVQIIFFLTCLYLSFKTFEIQYNFVITHCVTSFEIYDITASSPTDFDFFTNMFLKTIAKEQLMAFHSWATGYQQELMSTIQKDFDSFYNVNTINLKFSLYNFFSKFKFF